MCCVCFHIYDMKNFDEYINSINEGLIKTYDIDFTILTARRELSLLNVPFDIIKKENGTIILSLKYFFKVYIEEVFNFLYQTFTNILGWFPSYMYMCNTAGMESQMNYDEKYLKFNQNYLQKVSIIYESKFDEVVNLPEKLYHLSIQEYENKIIRIGICPKSKSKLSSHAGRIYVCDKLDSCLELIPKMKMYFFNKRNINTKWIIYEIDTSGLDIKLYKDPNFPNKGYYTTGNIPPNKIKVSTKEFKMK